ncbi:uncharacterized protein LOC125209327 [Salvia hispanica]|uniref:uncharacterized protein LOC125209327 n=1 Tax=Salvia hispanica TaxID=49212 RepID=UPI00200942F1|nr:uncharacterized protein LOC125209327 [Salvia hispanica]
MQILQWLLKLAEQEASRIATPITKHTLQKRKKKTSENKVLPIAGSSDQSWSSNELADSDKTKKKKKTTTTKKAVSRMKELLKRAVNWKKGGSKQVDYDVDSPKMRFGDDEIEKWINTIEKWITTDSEFVVLELSPTTSSCG